MHKTHVSDIKSSSVMLPAKVIFIRRKNAFRPLVSVSFFEFKFVHLVYRESAAPNLSNWKSITVMFVKKHVVMRGKIRLCLQDFFLPRTWRLVTKGLLNQKYICELLTLPLQNVFGHTNPYKIFVFHNIEKHFNIFKHFTLCKKIKKTNLFTYLPLLTFLHG